MSSRGVIHFHFLKGKDQLELLRGVEQDLGISIKPVVAGIRERSGVSPGLEVAESRELSPSRTAEFLVRAKLYSYREVRERSALEWRR